MGTLNGCLSKDLGTREVVLVNVTCCFIEYQRQQ